MVLCSYVLFLFSTTYCVKKLGGAWESDSDSRLASPTPSATDIRRASARVLLRSAQRSAREMANMNEKIQSMEDTISQSNQKLNNILNKLESVNSNDDLKAKNGPRASDNFDNSTN